MMAIIFVLRFFSHPSISTNRVKGQENRYGESNLPGALLTQMHTWGLFQEEILSETLQREWTAPFPRGTMKNSRMVPCHRHAAITVEYKWWYFETLYIIKAHLALRRANLIYFIGACWSFMMNHSWAKEKSFYISSSEEKTSYKSWILKWIL